MFIIFSYCSLSGYPKAKINGTMATQAAGGEVTSEDLQSNISSVLWQFKEFSNEVGTTCHDCHFLLLSVFQRATNRIRQK